jgi:putative spermidine/putrescine transport system permease protein
VTTFWRVTLPSIRPGLVAAGLFGFVTSFGNLEMSLFLVGPGPHDAADRDPAVSGMEDRSDRRRRLGDPDRADRAAMIVTDRYVKLSRVV